MSELQDILKKQLKNSGQSITKQRLSVFDVLAGQEPMSMQTIVKTLSGSVDRASVYRIIELFESLGIVQKLQIGWKYKIELTDSFHAHHHHISCLKCGKLISIDGDSHIEQDIQELAVKNNFMLVSHQLEIQGFCQACATS